MSSVIRHIAQIPVRTKYLLAVASDASGGIAADAPAFSLAGSWPATIGTVDAIPASVLNDNATALDVAAGALYRDLGRQIVVADDAEGNLHLAVYRQVQLVNSADTEGVGGAAPGYGCLFVRVWGADGLNVAVARTG